MFSPAPSESSFSGSAVTTPGSLRGPEMPAGLRIFDLRPRELYEQGHLDGSLNLDLPLTKHDFYGDAEAVRERWTELKEAFEREGMLDSEPSGHEDHDLKGKVLVVCEDGDSGAMATSMLRRKGWEAFSLLGGWREMGGWLGGRGIEDELK